MIEISVLFKRWNFFSHKLCDKIIQTKFLSKCVSRTFQPHAESLTYLPSDPPHQKEMGYERFLHDHAYHDPEGHTNTVLIIMCTEGSQVFKKNSLRLSYKSTSQLALNGIFYKMRKS